MGYLAFATVFVLALIVGIAVQLYERRPLGYEWLMIALAGAFGAYFASETVVGSTVPILESIKNWGPEFDGMFVVPAVIGAIFLAAITYLGMRTSATNQLAA